ncbi:MAG: hypothetical protein LBK61_06970 [Spirochaetaceae bacterium]|nr:hypothetical protein [Spirochaetaceae bacterium]
MFRGSEWPLRGAKTLPGFHPFANLSPILAEESAAGRSAPAGGENPAGFSSLCEPIPILAGESAAGRQNTVMWRLCFPFGGAMPPHDGILPAVTMPDRGGRNR